MAPNVPLAVSLQLEDAIQLVPTALLCLLYARRVRTLASSGQPVPGWRQGCFYAGCLVIAAALIGLGKAGEELLFVHMIREPLDRGRRGAFDRARPHRATAGPDLVGRSVDCI